MLVEEKIFLQKDRKDFRHWVYNEGYAKRTRLALPSIDRMQTASPHNHGIRKYGSVLARF